MHARPPRRTAGRATAVAAVLAFTSLLASCGGSDGDAKAPTPTKAKDTAATELRAAPEGKVATSEAVPSKGCGTSKVGAVKNEDHTILDDRRYLLTTPEEHDGKTPLPLVLDIHGLMEGAEVHAKMSGLPEFAQEHGFVVVQPHGTGTPIKWLVGLDPEENPDLAYFTALLDELEQDLCIDTSRVYATGLSNGAFMSSTLACVMADRITAIAPVAGLTFEDGCKPSRPVPVLAFHGTADPILLFNGGFGDLSGFMSGKDAREVELPEADLDGEGYPATARTWAKEDGCKPEPTDEDISETVIQRTWDCPAASPVTFDIVQGGGHSWPGSEFSGALAKIMGATDTTIEANELIWSFFQRFALPA